MKKWLDKYQNGREILFNKPIVPIVDDTYVKIPYISKPRKYNAEDIFVEPDKKYYIIHDNRNESDKIIHRRIGEELEKQKRLKAKLKSAVKVVDVASDLMQIGNFIPLPQAQVVGKWGNILGAGVDAFQAGMNVAENDYVNAGVNASSVLLPHIIENYGYKRDMFNTTPGSYADKIASFGDRSGQYIHLTPYVKHSSNPVIMKGVNFNRGLLGGVGVETAIDLNQKQQGGPIITNRGQWDYPGQTTIIPSNKITMTGVDYPVLGVDNTGYTKMMQPGMDYTFPGQYVTEYPMAQNGYQVPKVDDTYVRLPYVTIPPKGGFKYRDFPKETLAIRQKAYDVIEPSSYLDIDNYTRWKTGEKRNSFSDPRSEEAWKFYLGLTNPDETSYIKKSKYRPTINAVKPYYYSVDPLLEKDIFNAYKDKVQLNKTLQTDESELETPLSGKNAAAMLGRFGVSKGHDEKGDYLSYYDKYDLKDFAQTRTKGLPYSIYGRIYYPKKEQGGEMIKRADGSYSRRGLWDNIRANKGSGKAPTKEMLEQERKIRNQYEQGGVVLNAGGEKHRIYVKSTNRGEGVKGHIMVNHPTMDKGMWDTIDLTEKAGATTIAQGVAATKKWHRENPYKKQDGGEEYTYWRTGKPMVNDPSMDAISKVLLQRNLDKNFMQRAAGFGYQGGIPTRYIHGQDPNSNNISSLLMGSSDNQVFPTIIQTGPEQLSYQPYQTQEYLEAPSWDVADYFATKGYKRAANDMYGMEYKNGGYVVRRSHDRKGKTHVVIGPDGTKKYFGDSKMGQHPNDPARKKAFYARHKHNLAHNPYFRAFARATWEEGGETYAIGGQSTLNPIVKKDNRNWLDFLKN